MTTDVMVTKSEHEKERRAFWDARFYQHRELYAPWTAADMASVELAERDKRFPAPESEEK